MTAYADLPRDEETHKLLIEEVVFPIEYPMLSPITVDGEKMASLTVAEPTVLDIEASNKAGNGMEGTKRLMAQVMGLKPEDIQKFGSRDFSRLSELVAAFL